MTSERKYYVQLPNGEFVCQAVSEIEAIRKFWQTQAEKLFESPREMWPFLDPLQFQIEPQYPVHCGDPEESVTVDWLQLVLYAIEKKYGEEQTEKWFSRGLDAKYGALDAA